MPRPTRVRAAVLLGLILAVAGALRFWYVVQLPGQHEDFIFSDMGTYDYTAWQLVNGRPMTGEPGLNGLHPLGASTYYYIGYTYFVAFVYALRGHDPAAVRLAQAALGTLTVALVYVVGVQAFRRGAGLVAAALAAVYLPFVYYAGLLLSETWFVFLQMASLSLWLAAWGPASGETAGLDDREPRRGSWTGVPLALAAGVVGGFACLSRTAYVLGAAALAAGAVVIPPVRLAAGPRIGRAAAFLAGAALVIAPITVRNYQIHGRFILISTNGPSTFLTGHVTHVTSLPTDTPKGISDAEMSVLHRNRVIRYLEHNLGRYLGEIPEHFAIVWMDDDFWPSTSTYWTQNDTPDRPRLDIRAHLGGSPPFGQVSYFPDLLRYNDRLVWGLIGLPMGVLAALFLPREHRRWSVLYLAVLPYLVIPFIAYPFSRYRIPAVPIVFVLAGQALCACWDARTVGRRAT